jgi:hypothetical protein
LELDAVRQSLVHVTESIAGFFFFPAAAATDHQFTPPGTERKKNKTRTCMNMYYLHSSPGKSMFF